MESSSTLPVPSANDATVIAQQPKVDPEGTRKRDLPFKHSNDKLEPEHRVRLRLMGRVGTPYGSVSYRFVLQAAHLRSILSNQVWLANVSP
jgi:hypothetical protein